MGPIKKSRKFSKVDWMSLYLMNGVGKRKYIYLHPVDHSRFFWPSSLVGLTALINSLVIVAVATMRWRRLFHLFSWY